MTASTAVLSPKQPRNERVPTTSSLAFSHVPKLPLDAGPTYEGPTSISLTMPRHVIEHASWTHKTPQTTPEIFPKSPRPPPINAPPPRPKPQNPRPGRQAVPFSGRSPAVPWLENKISDDSELGREKLGPFLRRKRWPFFPMSEALPNPSSKLRKSKARRRRKRFFLR